MFTHKKLSLSYLPKKDIDLANKAAIIIFQLKIKDIDQKNKFLLSLFIANLNRKINFIQCEFFCVSTCLCVNFYI